MFLVDTWEGVVNFVDRVRNSGVPAVGRIEFDPAARAASAQPQEINPIARWAIGLYGANRKPYAVLHCTCKTDTRFELPGNGSMPVPNCCKNAPQYPNDEVHQRHLFETGTVSSTVTPFAETKDFAGLPPEPGTGEQYHGGEPAHSPGGRKDEPAFSTAEISALTKMIDADVKAAEKDAEVIAAAYGQQK